MARVLMACTSEPPEGSVIVYAASPGRVASDGSGRNSPFTKNLLREIGSEEHVLLMLQNVVKGVRKDTSGQQLPWFHTSLTGDFYFNPPAADAATETPGVAAAAPVAPPATQPDEANSKPLSSRIPEPEAIQATPPQAEPAQEAAPVAALNTRPAMPAGDSLQGRWKGRLRKDAGPGAAVTLDLKQDDNGDYAVAVSRLISYGEVPASCTFASGRLTGSDAGGLNLDLIHPGCRGSGKLQLQGGSLTGNLRIDGNEIMLELSRQ